MPRRPSSYGPEKHHRRSIRLPGYDYSQPGAYYVIICTQGQQMLLERFPVKAMIQAVWEALPQRFPGLDLDAFVVMPDHVHGIIIIGDTGRGEPGVRPVGRADTRSAPTHTFHRAFHGSVSLARIIQAFKSLTTVAYISGLKSEGWKPFVGRLWQRNYYEHIIRNEDELDRAREYVVNNPLRDGLDQENPLPPEAATDAHH